MVHVLASMEHEGIAFRSSALTQQQAPMHQRLQQLRATAATYVGPRGDLDKVLNNKQAREGCLSDLLYRRGEDGGLGLIPPVGTAKGM